MFLLLLIRLCTIKANATMSDMSDDDEESVTVTGVAAAPIIEVTSIFEDDMIEKFSDKDGKPRWKCKWCGGIFAGWNATKAICHLNKIPKQDIKLCKAKIDIKYVDLYNKLFEQLKEKRSRTKSKYHALGNSIHSHNTTVAASLEKHRSDKRLKRDGSFGGIPFSMSSDVVSNTSNSNATNTDKYIQTVLYNQPNPNADSKLTMAIADFVHSCGLPFRIISDRKFHTVLNLARTTSTSFVPPSRQSVATDLLDLNYDAYMKTHYEKLYKDIDTFGVSFYGDGATIKKLPLINVLASGCHITACVIEIVDCSKHIQNGGKKDASFISSLFRPHIDKMEAAHQNCIDVVYFDGASNVQKAGFVLEAKYPRIVVLHGAEHVISLFFNDVFNLKIIKALLSITKRAYRVFGNGAMHGPYWIFQKYSKSHNNGRNIGLIRAAGTRMAGQAITMMRFLRLKNALLSTINSPEFIKLKVSISIHYNYF
jgi:Protein of unknown function (DUF 659)